MTASAPATVGGCVLHHGDCLDVLRGMGEASVDSVVCDPPYNLGFMGKKWDTPGSFVERQPDRSVKFDRVGGNHNPCNPQDAARSRGVQNRRFQDWCEAWAREVYRVMKPGAHLVAFGGTRTYHRMVCAIEDAGFEIRDQLGWVYGTGFPKSRNIGKDIDRAAGVEREVVGVRQAPGFAKANVEHGAQQRGIYEFPEYGPAVTPEAAEWQGWGTALKPSREPVLLAQKPFEAVPSWDILSQSTALIEAMLWSIAPAKFAALCFGSSRNECGGDPSGSARWIVAAEHGARSAALSELTAMFSSPETASTFLSIVWLWNGILAASSSGPSTFTTETRSSLTTGLKTLNCLISAITPESTIRAATLTNGSWWSADAAESRSSGTPGGSSGTPRPSARESASWNSASAIASALASIAEASFPLHQVTRDCSAEPIVIRRIEPLTGDTIPSRTDLSPNLRPIVLARKPLACPTVAAQVLATGTGALNVDGCRVATDDNLNSGTYTGQAAKSTAPGWRMANASRDFVQPAGRWPPNLLHDGSPEVLAAFGRFGGDKGAAAPVRGDEPSALTNGILNPRAHVPGAFHGDTGTAARFFPALGFGDDELRFNYSAKASKADRCGSRHPTVKPLTLMRWLCRLVTPPGGVVLDCFAGTGVTGEAALREGFRAVLIEREAEYFADMRRRLGRPSGADTPLFADQDTAA